MFELRPLTPPYNLGTYFLFKDMLLLKALASLIWRFITFLCSLGADNSTLKITVDFDDKS